MIFPTNIKNYMHVGCCTNLAKGVKKVKKIGVAYKKLILNENAEQAETRLKICKKCPHKIIGICDLCGCVVRAKVREETEQCPINKW